MNVNAPLTTDELDAVLDDEPWLAGYIETGDTDLEAARLRWEADQLLAVKALRSAGIHLVPRLVRGEMLTTCCDRDLVR